MQRGAERDAGDLEILAYLFFNLFDMPFSTVIREGTRDGAQDELSASMT